MRTDVTHADALQMDGERFMPDEMHGNIELEHCHRYCFASQLVSDKAVLDIACGEGYGSALLARSARHVTGVDIAEAAVAHAKRRYPAENLEFLNGSCTAIPLGDHTIDVVVSFETIEHHAEHDAMMREIIRVLRPGGLLVISSPDKLEYSDKPSFSNPFHVKELYKEQFESLLGAHFRNVRMLGQRVVLGSMLLAQQRSQGIRFQRHERGLVSTSAGLDPLYCVALASDDHLPPTPDSVYEQPTAELWAKVAQQRNSETTSLIRTVATPNSRKLKSCLEASWYLQRNSDIAAAAIDPYQHWIVTGAEEGRLPSSDTLQLVQELLRERAELLHQDFHGRQEQLVQAHNEREQRVTAEALRQRETFEAERAQLAAAADRRLAALEAESAERERLLQQDKQGVLERLQYAQTQSHEILEQSQQREQQLRRDIQRLEERLQSTQDQALAALEQARRESQEQAGQAQKQFDAQRASLQQELTRTRREASEQVDSLLRELAARERAVAERLAQQQAELDSERYRQAQVTDHKLETIAAEHAIREREIQQDLQDVRERLERTRREASEQADSLLRELAARERTLADRLAQQQAEFDSERQRRAQAADHELKRIVAEHASREQQMQQDLQNVRERLARTRQDADERLQAQLQRSIEREQVFAGKLLEQEAGFDRQLQMLTEELARRDLQMRQEIVSLHERWSRAIAEERSALQVQYSSVLLFFKRDVEALQASAGWRLAAPIRALAATFGSKTILPRIQQIESLVRLPAHTGE